MKDKQNSLFPDFENEWEREWHDMPEFIQEDKEPIKQLIVSFNNFEDYKRFAKLINQPLTRKTQSIWFPPAKIDTYADKRYTVNFEIGDIFYFNSHGEKRAAIFKEDLGEKVLAVLTGDRKYEGVNTEIEKQLIYES